MNPIPNINLAEIANREDKQYQREVEQAIANKVKGLKYDLFNKAQKRIQLEEELRKLDTQIEESERRVTRLMAGDWSAMEPIELKMKAKGDNKKEDE